MRVVLDSNVLVAALRSRNGASFQLLTLLRGGRFEVALSVPLAFRTSRFFCAMQRELALSKQEAVGLVDYFAKLHINRRYIFYGGRLYGILATNSFWNLRSRRDADLS